MAAPLLGSAIKALASGGAKKAAMGAVKGVATDKAKDFVSGKKRKGKGGALVKSGRGDEEQVEGGRGGAIVPTTPMVGSYKVETVPDKPDEVGKPSKISYESINNQLDSIIGLTNVLKKTSAAKIKNAENRRKAERKADEKDKKRQKESLLEKGAGKVVGMAGNLYGKATEGFDPFKFFTMIFLGNLVKWFNENGSKIAAPLRAGLALMNNAAKAIRAGLKALGGAFKGGFKLIGKLPGAILRLGKSVGKTLFNVGKGLGKAFISIGRRLFKFIRGLLGKLRIPGLPRLPRRGPTLKGPTPKGRGPTPKGRTSPKALPPGNKQVAPRAGNPRLQQPPTTTKPTSPKPRPLTSVNKFLKKLFGITKPQEVESLRKAAPTLKKGSNFMKGARIPVVGPMIVFALNALDPDISLGEAAFKAVGTGLGEFLGFAIPIPVLGPIIGGLVGEVMGAAAYSLIVEKDPAAAGQKIMDAVTATGKFLGPILDWGKGVVVKFFDALPKVNVFGQEFLNPLALVPPMLVSEVPKALMNAFFGKPMEKGKVKKVESKSKPEKMMTEQEYYNARVEDTGLPDTYEEYKSKFTGPTPSGSTEYGEASLLRAAREAGYEGKELAAFMAQMAHESGNFVYDREISGGRSDYGGGGPYTLPDGRVVPAKYHGRGYIQLTHDYNYKQYGDELGIDLLNNPDLAMRGDIAAKIAILYWQKNVRPTVKGDWDNVFLHSKAINYPAATKPSQVNGMADRQAKYDKYLKKLGSGQLTKMEKSEGKPVIKPQTYTTAGVTYDLATGLPISGHEPTPAQVSPSTQSQSQMSNGITGLSQQLSYEQTGNTVVMMQASSDQQSPMGPGSGGKGTPIIMGSGDVVNSYHKSQVLGSLYKS